MQKIVILGALVLAIGARSAPATIIKSTETSFSLEHEITLPLTPEAAYDVMTGDVSGWWDHTFSGSPSKLYIEPIPGGCFCEIFDESGDGVKHAEVTYADRGKMLRMVGPLGLAGSPFTMIMTFSFEAREGRDGGRMG